LGALLPAQQVSAGHTAPTLLQNAAMKPPLVAVLLLIALSPSPRATGEENQPADQTTIASLTKELAKKQAELDQEKGDKEKILALIKRVENQQGEIEDNQILINTQLSESTEKVRQAWVFSRRASL
jgi:septal ring factor EnvC (AmiA/AmiB activator)